MNIPQVSIIIPVYNGESFIRETIDAVISQTYGNFELIIVNDGSTDSTHNICKEYASVDNRIKYIKTENRGAGTARNTGLDEAVSKYIMFIDDDDVVDSDYVEKMYSAIMVDDADIAVCDIENINVATNEKSISKIRLPYGLTEATSDKAIISKIRTFCWGKIYRKVLWIDNNIRFPEGDLYRTLPGFEDVCCLPLAAAYVGKIVHVKNCVYHYYRGHENGLMYKSRFDYFYNGQKEIMNRFISSGLEKEYHPYLLRFFLGQFASANRWKITNTEKSVMWEFLKQYFPEFYSLQNYKVYAPKGVRYDVLKNVFFDRASFVDKLEDDECVLNIDIPEADDTEDYETFCYDAADDVISRLTENSRDN